MIPDDANSFKPIKVTDTSSETLPNDSPNGSSDSIDRAVQLLIVPSQGHRCGPSLHDDKKPSSHLHCPGREMKPSPSQKVQDVIHEYSEVSAPSGTDSPESCSVSWKSLSNSKLFIALSYFILATLMPFINKQLLCKFENYPMITLSYLCQVIILTSIHFIQSQWKEHEQRRRQKIIQEILYSIHGEHYNPDRAESQISTTSSLELSFKDLRLLAPIAIINQLSFSFSQYGLKNLNIAVQDQIKRCSPLFSIVLFYFLTRVVRISNKSRKYSYIDFLSIITITVGGAVAVIGVDGISYGTVAIATAAVFLKALYLNLTDYYGKYYTPSSFNLKVLILSVVFLPFTCYYLERNQLGCLWSDLHLTTKNMDSTTSTNESTSFFIGTCPSDPSSYDYNKVELISFLLAQSLLGLLMKEIHTRSCVVCGAVETSVMKTGNSLVTTIIACIFSITVIKKSSKFYIGLALSFIGTITMMVHKVVKSYRKKRAKKARGRTGKPGAHRVRNQHSLRSRHDDEDMMISRSRFVTMAIDDDIQPNEMLIEADDEGSSDRSLTNSFDEESR